MNPRDRIKLLGAGLAGLGVAGMAQAQNQGPVAAQPISTEPWKVAMQLSDGLEQAYEGLINIQNVLQLCTNDPMLLHQMTKLMEENPGDGGNEHVLHMLVFLKTRREFSPVTVEVVEAVNLCTFGDASQKLAQAFSVPPDLPH